MPRGKVNREVKVERRIARRKYTVPVKLSAPMVPNKLPTKAFKVIKREPDPIITMLQNVIDEAFPGRSRDAWVNAACEAMVCYSTIRKLMEGTTTRPWHSTVKSIFTACGYDYLVQRKA